VVCNGGGEERVRPDMGGGDGERDEVVAMVARIWCCKRILSDPLGLNDTATGNELVGDKRKQMKSTIPHECSYW